jgi:mannan endo-1,4-beta-mannosidase
MRLNNFDIICFAVILTLLGACSGGPERAKKPVNLLKNAPFPRTPVEPSPNKKRLLNYLADVYGKYIISGQMDTAWTTNAQMDMIARVYTDTDKYPALKGFDLLNLPYGKSQIDEAVEWWEGKNKMNGVTPAAQLLPERPDIHGIVAFCWHWRAGETKEFYTNKTFFFIPWNNGKLDTSSEFFTAIINDLDRVAALFQILKDKDIPILWRPLHEASGRWFWWGAGGPEPYIALWEYMYDYFTYVKGLNNLIWVWNGDNGEWLPDPATVDIVGRDLYTNSFTSQKPEFEKSRAMVPAGQNRMIALTENGRIPDPDECIKDEAMWLWFMTWNDRSRSVQGETHKENNWTGEFNNTNAHKRKVYHHPAVITLDKLPDLTSYRLE